jgi:hypothetical protein
VDYVRRQAAREAAAGDWKLTDRVVVPVAAKNARQSLVEAIDEWDREAADYAVTQLLLEWTPAEVLQLLAPYSARDYRSIGHKVIAASNAYRMMVANDGFAASQLVRSLVIAITNSEGDPNPGANDFAADRTWNRTLELSAGTRYPPSKTVDDWKAGSAILSSLRTVNDLEAVGMIATAADGGLSEQVIWEALIASVGEQMLREGSFIAIHSNTMVDALRHLYSVSRDEISRRRIMLQAASLVANIRAHSSRARRKTRIEDYEAADPVVNLQEVFVSMGDSRIEAVSGALSFLDDGGDAEALIGTIRYYTLDRASNSHDFKYSEAVIKNYRYMRGPWKNRYLATAMLSVNGPHNRHNRIVNEGRELLSA